jgi:ComF family protein
MKLLSRLWRFVVDTLVPPRKTERLARLVTIEKLKTLRRGSVIGNAEALLPYEDPRVQSLIWELKYYGSTHAATLLGKLLAEELSALVSESLSNKPLLIPIPLHPNRKAMRGYNQMERITRIAAALCDDLVEHAPLLLVRVADTPRQTALPRSRRIHNMTGAFAVADTTRISGRTCIIVDDVVTTGSTLEAATRALKQAGADSVIVLALAHAG